MLANELSQLASPSLFSYVIGKKRLKVIAYVLMYVVCNRSQETFFSFFSFFFNFSFFFICFHTSLGGYKFDKLENKPKSSKII